MLHAGTRVSRSRTHGTPVGPYTPIVRSGDWLIASGQVGLGADGLVGGGMAAELRQAFANLRALLASEGADLADVVKTTVFLVDMADYGADERGLHGRVR